MQSTWLLNQRSTQSPIQKQYRTLGQLTIPALQRVASRACVACGAAADSFCARCGLTPYCSAACQRRDWTERHRAVCHNLARLSEKTEVPEPIVEDKDIPPPPAPLRRPHSPKREPQRNDDDADRGLKNSQYKNSPMQNNKPGGRNFNQGPRNFNKPSDRPQGYKPQDRPQGNRPQGQRPPLRHENKDENESWDNKNNKPTPASTPPVAIPTPKPPAEVPKPAPKEAEQPKPVNGCKAPGSLSDAKPAKKIVPKNYLIELLKLGDTALLSVEALASESRAKKGYVCLSVNEGYEAEYQLLCEQYTVDTEAQKTVTYKPNPGETFSYLNPADGGWYRARLLTPTLAALIDSGKVVTLTGTDKLQPLLTQYEKQPEFCCLLNAANIEVGLNLKCTLLSKTAEGYKVSLENVETGATAGEGDITRWLPEVEYPAPPSVNTAPALIPEVPRPDLTNNSSVVLVDATAMDRAFVRPSDTAAQRAFDAIEEDTVLYGRKATPLKEPPQKGQVVIAKCGESLRRALCKRTNVKQNKYLLEFIEYGNIEISPLENLYACPPNLDLPAQPTQASLVVLQKDVVPLTAPAIKYLEQLKEGAVELTLTTPSGAKTAPSGSLVNLAVAQSRASVNKRVAEMCTPEWKKIEEQGGDVVDTPPLMYGDLEYQELPPGGCSLDVLDISALAEGSVSACAKGTHNLDSLTEQMAAYCNSEIGKQPYLPKFEELCVARFPPYPQWFRAVLLEQAPGAASARVCYVDYGNVDEVPVEMLRKMLPEFVRNKPALASHLEIKDFPQNVTPDQLGRAIEHMKINDEGRGELKVVRCEKQENGLYLVHAPDLIRAMRG